VDIMNASTTRYPPRELVRPPGLKQIEICSKSGLLATDKCYDTIKNESGESVQRRTTYQELATSAQTPTEPCNVHGESRSRLVRELPAGDWPRAALAVDTSQVPAVVAKGPTLLAENDPYNAVKSTVKPKPAEEVPDNGMPDPTKPVLKAQPVEPSDGKPVLKAQPVEPATGKPVEVRRAEPVHPMDEVPDDSILKNTPPQALNPDDE
jgi:hypothetical protein